MIAPANQSIPGRLTMTRGGKPKTTNDAVPKKLNLKTTARNWNMTTNMDAMSFDELVPSESKYLAKSDVGEDGLILTIKGFTRETLKSDDGDEEKTVLYFVEAVKPMVVNRTNSQLIAVATGAKTAGEAKGKQIVVYNDPTVGFGGKITGGIRIKKIAGAPRAPKAPPVYTGQDEADQDVPF